MVPQTLSWFKAAGYWVLGTMTIQQFSVQITEISFHGCSESQEYRCDLHMAAANQEMSGDSTEQVGAVVKCPFPHGLRC